MNGDGPSPARSTVPRLLLSRKGSPPRSKGRGTPNWVKMRHVQKALARGCSFEYRCYTPLVPSRLRDVRPNGENLVSWPLSCEDVVEEITCALEVTSMKNFIDAELLGESAATDGFHECSGIDYEEQEVDDWIMGLLEGGNMDSSPPPQWIFGEDGNVTIEFQELIDELNAIGNSISNMPQDYAEGRWRETLDSSSTPAGPVHEILSQAEKAELTAEGWVLE